MSFAERFLSAETAFVAALSSGTTALAQFDADWEALGKEFELALDQSIVDASETEVAYAVSSRIAVLGDSFLKLEDASASFTTKTLNEIDATLSRLNIHDTDPTTTQPLAGASPRHTPPYIAAAFSWLLNNIHDPYPSSSLKRVWARDAGISTRVMDDWFKSIRKEIGWVAYTKAHFNGSRSLAIAAASTVLLDHETSGDVPFEVQTELLAIKARVENLFVEERELAARRSTRKSNKRTRSASASSSTTDVTSTSRSFSPSVQSDNSSDSTSTVSSSPSGASLGLPSLVFDQSDSEEDELFPEFSSPGLVNNAAIHVAGLKDDVTSERRLKRSRHSYYDLSVGDSPSSWPLDPFTQLIDTQAILSNDLVVHPDFWSFPIVESSSPETSTTALIDVIPTVDNVSASPIVAASTSRKRRHEEAELEIPASKKSRVTRNLPRSNARKEQKASGATPVLVANTPSAPIEEPIIIDWEQLLKDLEEATSIAGGGSFDVTGHVDCNVFDFAALEPAASTSISNVDDSWDKLFSADVFGSNSAPTDEELFASFTNVDALAGPDFSASADVSTVSIELPLPSDLGLGTELASELPAYGLSSSTASPFAQAGQPEVSSLCSGSDNTTQLAIPNSVDASPSIFDVLSRLDSGGSFDTYSPPLIAF